MTQTVHRSWEPRSHPSLIGGIVHITGRRGDEEVCLPAIIIQQYGTNAVYGLGVLLGIIGTSQTIYHTDWHTAYDCRYSRDLSKKDKVAKPEEAILCLPQPRTRRNRNGAQKIRPVPPQKETPP